jgi:hypothetical protein
VQFTKFHYAIYGKTKGGNTPVPCSCSCQALVSTDGILLRIISKLQHLGINLGSIFGGQLVNSLLPAILNQVFYNSWKKSI